MIDELPDPDQILEDTDWAGLSDRNGAAHPTTPTMLLGLTSGDSQAAQAALFYLSYELIEFPNVYSAAVPTALYVAALVGDRRGEDLLASGAQRRRPLRADLLAWLSSVVDAVSDAMEREFVDLAGYSPMDHPSSTFRKVRAIRPQIYAAVAGCLDDQDPAVRNEALAAAVVIVQAPELASQRSALVPLLRNVLAETPNPARRQWATTALEAWGEHAGSTGATDD